MSKNKIHFRVTGNRRPEFECQLRVKTSHIIDDVRGSKDVDYSVAPWKSLGSCPFEASYVYYTNSVDIVEHFSRVFFNSAALNSHLAHRTLSIKFYDERGFEYIIVDRKTKTE